MLLNEGKTLRESKGDVAWAARAFEYYSGLADKIQGETIPVPPRRLDYTLREPLGVTVHIVPWNYPIALASRSVAPALAAGDTVVLKPSELTPLTALKLGELASKAGLPKGVMNVVTGAGSDIDADVAKALRAVKDGIFTNAGQMCWAGSRAFIHESIYDGFVRDLVAKTKTMKLGPGIEDASEMGPLASKQRVETVLGYVKDGVEEGAKLLVGGSRPGEPRLTSGNFVEPTIFGDVTADMKVGCDEIFGPVLTVTKFGSLDEVVKMANDTEYGLYGGVWTNNLKTAHEAASRLQVGAVAINEYLVTFPQTPFGGYKESLH